MARWHEPAVSQAASEIHDLRRALESRTVISTAIGILIERHRISEDQAFAMLVRTSQSQNVKLRLIAATVVADTASRHPRIASTSADHPLACEPCVARRG